MNLAIRGRPECPPHAAGVVGFKARAGVRPGPGGYRRECENQAQVRGRRGGDVDGRGRRCGAEL